MEKIQIYTNGLVHCSVCVEKELSRSEIEREVNLVNPTGIDSRWKISNEDFADKNKNPHKCEKDKNRLHYLMVC